MPDMSSAPCSSREAPPPETEDEGEKPEEWQGLRPVAQRVSEASRVSE